MTETFYLVSGEGPNFEPLSGTVVRQIDLVSSLSNKPNEPATVINLTPPLHLNLGLLRNTKIQYAIVSAALEGVSMFPITRWPYPALLHRYVGSTQELLTLTTVPYTSLATLDKILLCRTEEDALKIYKTKWD